MIKKCKYARLNLRVVATEVECAKAYVINGEVMEDDGNYYDLESYTCICDSPMDVAMPMVQGYIDEGYNSFDVKINIYEEED